MKQKLFILSFFCLSSIYTVVGQSNDSVSGPWSVTTQKNNSGEVVFKRTKYLKFNTPGLSLNSDSLAIRVLYTPGCGLGKRRPKGLKGKWKTLSDNTIEVTSENPYKDNHIVEKYRIVKSNSRKTQLVRIHYVEIPNKE